MDSFLCGMAPIIRLAAGEILPPFLFRGLYLTVKMVYYKCEVFYE